MLPTLSALTQSQIEEIRSLERELGKTILSFSGCEASFEELSPGELERIRELEDRIGTMLVAVKGEDCRA
ncbi:hypothetical protein [Pelodictyon luteolum]|uniref:Uncharacterized protein n=1 Tax=Chlorobium luteolum (strain DSM 273 / BCRC 81028 / 2530) TaxID=319225 RepID=Q3B137_CHLL3|nr:hypothetical protein [Pelodictyon luteolum]ABB24944.1 conserved hypothetical protein [Pelodictyon luteolum DSM 273]